MKNLMISTGLAALLAGTALAQTPTEGTTTQGDTTQGATEGATQGATQQGTSGTTMTVQGDSELFQSQRSDTDMMASDLIGMRIYASETQLATDSVEGAQQDWNDIGEVNDLILSQDGQVQAVLVDIGGFLGMGERQVAVRMSSLKFVRDASGGNEGDFFLVMNANRAALESAPMYSRNGDAQGITSGAAATGAAVDDGSQAPAASDTGMATGDARQPITREGYAPVEREQLTSETLTGAEIYGSQDERIGKVAELVLTPEGQVTDIVLDVGGFLGIGSKRVALPISEVDILRSDQGGNVRVYVPYTKEQLDSLNEYEG